MVSHSKNLPQPLVLYQKGIKWLCSVKGKVCSDKPTKENYYLTLLIRLRKLSTSWWKHSGETTSNIGLKIIRSSQTQINADVGLSQLDVLIGNCLPMPSLHYWIVALMFHQSFCREDWQKSETIFVLFKESLPCLTDEWKMSCRHFLLRKSVLNYLDFLVLLLAHLLLLLLLEDLVMCDPLSPRGHVVCKPQSYSGNRSMMSRLWKTCNATKTRSLYDLNRG